MPEIEYFYSTHSAYAYLGAEYLTKIAARTGRTIYHRPVNLERVVSVTGPGWTNNLTPERHAYFSGREIQRWAEMRGLPIIPVWPSHHDNDVTLANCLVIAAQDQGLDADALSHALLKAHWCRDADLADIPTLKQLTVTAGLDPDAQLAVAESSSVRATHEANTRDAIERSVFGSPTYFVDGDMFFGQDHLDLVERACRQPFVSPKGFREDRTSPPA